MKKIKIGLLPKILIAIAIGTLVGLIAPVWLERLSLTLSTLFSNFLGFVIPLIIIGLVTPGIADLGDKAGKLLLLTVAIAYGSSLFSGFFTWGISSAVFPFILNEGAVGGFESGGGEVAAYFSISMPPLMDIMTALILSFIVGIAAGYIRGNIIKGALNEFKDIVTLVINKAIIPLLPFYIGFIFLNLSAGGLSGEVFGVFFKVIVMIFILHIALLLIYFITAAAIAGGNPFRYLRNMLPAYFTALGTQSSAATIPVTLEQTLKNGVDEEVADFTVPLCATIHLSGSMMKITACALAIMYVSGTEAGIATMIGFIFMLGITMIAAPGVPGGAIMAAIGVLTSILGFDESMIALMIALYIAMDSFGTACNVTGDGAIAIVVNKIYKKS